MLNPPKLQKQPERFDAENHPAGIFRRLSSERRDAIVAFSDPGHIVFKPSKGVYFATAMDMAEFCSSSADHCTVKPIAPHTSYGNIENVYGVSRPVEELLWQTGFYPSNGRLLNELSDYHVVHFSHWPNLTRMPTTPNTMRIFALFVRHATGIGLARRLLKVDRAEIYQVISAAALSGVLVIDSDPKLASALPNAADDEEVKAAEADAAAHESDRRHGIFGLLLAKIRGL